MMMQTKNNTPSEKELKQVLIDLLENYESDPKKYIPKLENLVAKFPDQILFHELLANLKSKDEKSVDEAIQGYSECIKLNPKESKYYYFRSTVYQQVGDYEKAHADLRKAQELSRDHAYVPELMELELHFKHFEAAYNLFKEARWEDTRETAEQMHSIAAHYREIEQYDKAKDILAEIKFLEEGAPGEMYDPQDEIDEINESLHQREIEGLKNKTFSTVDELFLFFWKISAGLRGARLVSLERLLPIAFLIFYKRIIERDFSQNQQDAGLLTGKMIEYSWTNLSKAAKNYNVEETHLLLEEGVRELSNIPLYSFLNSLDLPFGSLFDESLALSQLTDKDIVGFILTLDEYNFYESNIDSYVFGQAFSQFLSRWIQLGNKTSAESGSNDLLISLIHNQLSVTHSESVFDPAAGLGGWLAYSGEKKQHINTAKRVGGFEVNNATYLLACMNLSLNRISPDHLVKANALELSYSDNANYSVSICHPPFGQNLKQIEDIKQNTTIEFHTQATELMFLQVMLSRLRPDGKFAVILPVGCLMSGGSNQEYRKFLIENDFVDKVIGLPSGVHKNTKVKTALVLGTKRSAPREKRMLWFADISTEADLRSIGKQPSNMGIPGSSGIHSNPFSSYNYILEPTRWIEGHSYDSALYAMGSDDSRPLGSVVVHHQTGVNYSKNQVAPSGKYPLVRVSELTTDPINNTLSFSDNRLRYMERTLNKHHYISEIDEKHLVKWDCLLIATKGRDLKPTIFRYTGNPIVIASGVVALSPSLEICSLEYLSNEFQSGHAEGQATLLRTGAYTPNLKLNDLLNILIEVPSVSEQKSRIQRYQSLVRKQISVEATAQSFLAKRDDDFARSLELMQHQLKHHVASIKMNTELIEKYFLRKHPDLLRESTLLNTPSDEKVAAQHTVEESLKKLTSAAQNMISEMGVINQRKELEHDIERKDYVLYEQLKRLKQSFETEDVKIHLKHNKKVLSADQRMLEIMFDLILRNAIRHGKITDTILNVWIESGVDLDVDGIRYFQILIKNDGAPLHQAFTLDLFKTYRGSVGPNQNRGVGGNHIDFIIQKHDGFIRRFENTETGLVELEILLPMRGEQ